MQRFTPAAVAVALVLSVSPARLTSHADTLPTDDPSTRSGSSRPDSRDDKTIVHALNRLGFGPRPGDVAKVREMGLQRYIDQQLHPEKIADPAMAPRLAGLRTIGLSSREIATELEIPLLEARRQRQQQAGQNGTETQPPPTPEMQRRNNQTIVELSEQKLLRAIYSERQLQEVLTDFWFNHFNVDARKGRDRFLLTEYEREAIRPHVLGRFRDLLEATAKSPAMLFYLDNWMSADPDGPHPQARDAVRPRFGRTGVGRRSIVMPRPAQQAGNRRKRGLNENYGRELLELHTLGVDAGYTQKDVTEVARAFTGWTIDNPRQGGGYTFEARLHDPGEKTVLGHKIKAGGGERDGEQVLDILAGHPATARFITTKLVRRFVADTPPPSLVDRAAARFRETDGDLREVMRTILTSPEFFSPEAYRAKVKTPLEFVVGVARTTGAEVEDATPLVRALQQLGMPLYGCQPPTGYKDTADAWVNTGALVNRMNIALALAGNQMRGISVDSRQLASPKPAHADTASGGGSTVDNRPPASPKFASGDTASVAGASIDSRDWVTAILNGDVSEATLATIAKATTVPQVVALTLGSPEFQRR
jgi:uncharacterized protein (DUF1800 family)